MAHIFPLATDENQTSADEHSLAETLLNRLHIPKAPVVHDEFQKEADEEMMVIQPKKEAEESKESEDEEEKAEVVTLNRAGVRHRIFGRNIFTPEVVGE